MRSRSPTAVPRPLHEDPAAILPRPLHADPTAVPRPLHEDPAIAGRRWFLLAIMCLSVVLVVMSVAGLNVALPTMQESLGASASQLQWIVDSYAVLFAGLLLTAGAVGDRFGRRRALLAGLVVFGIGATLGGLASDASQVIAGRAVMGVGAALVMPATLSIITAIFPPGERAKAIAVWAGFAGGGAAIGPIISGALLEGYWWGATLLVNVPVVAATLLAVWAFAPESRDDARTPLDPAGAALSLVGLSALIYAIIQGPEDGWTSAPVGAAFAVAALALGAFVAVERRAAHPMLPLSLFRQRRFTVASWVITATFFVMFGFFFLATQYLQFARGYSALEAGLATLPLALAFVALSPRSASLAERFGAPRVMALGMAIVAIGLGIFSVLSPGTSYLVLGTAFAVLGAGMSITAAPATAEIMASVPLSKAGVASAVNDTTRELGGALGIAMIGSIANTAYRSGVDLGGVDLPAPARAAAGESIGGAHALASQVPGADPVMREAATAFTDAFNLANRVSVALVLGAAAVVLATARRRSHGTADEAARADEVIDLDLTPAAATAAEDSSRVA
jgi:MFS transporter, DHA2 family, integral membrane protein